MTDSKSKLAADRVAVFRSGTEGAPAGRGGRRRVAGGANRGGSRWRRVALSGSIPTGNWLGQARRGPARVALNQIQACP